MAFRQSQGIGVLKIRVWRPRAFVLRYPVRPIAAAWALHLLGAAAFCQVTSVPAESASGFAQGSKRLFALKSQPLDDALNAFGAIARVQIYYENSLTAGLLSRPVEGEFDPETALRVLLYGSGLGIRMISGNTLSIVPERSETAYAPYFDAMEATVIDALCASNGARPGSYRAVLQYWLDSHGSIVRLKIVSQQGSPARSQAIAKALGAAILPPPPTDMPGPMTVIIEPDGDATVSPCKSSP